MNLKTKNFGEIEIPAEKIIHFPKGLIAFEDTNKYIIIDNPDKDIPFSWLQSIDKPDLAFVIINPYIFKPDYEFYLPKHIIKELEIEKETDVAVYNIVVIPDNIKKMTANLMAPIIINAPQKLGQQIILENTPYQTKHYILEEMQKNQQGGE